MMTLCKDTTVRQNVDAVAMRMATRTTDAPIKSGGERDGTSVPDSLLLSSVTTCPTAAERGLVLIASSRRSNSESSKIIDASFTDEEGLVPPSDCRLPPMFPLAFAPRRFRA